MTSVSPGDSTVAFIRKKVRRLTASSGESVLPTSLIDEYINNFYNSDFPYAIKIDQMRSVYTFFTEPNRDRYPLDVNFNQGIRGPVYIEGILGALFKDRQQFFNLYPRWPNLFHEAASTSTTLTGSITGIAQPTNPTQITSPAHGLVSNAVITITGVIGMTQLNGMTFTITVIDPNTFSLNGIDNTTFGAYVSGGTWSSTSIFFSFTLPAPFLSREVVIGGVDLSGNPISINDDGNGNLQLKVPNPVVSVPLQTTNPALPGMYNINTGNPGLINPTNIGTVNYVTGDFLFTLQTPLALGTLLTIWISQYQTGRPYSLLFWNNEFTIRPIPKLIHKIEVETFLTPVQFMESTDNPILNQWSQYIAFGSAAEILRDRQDMEGLANVMEGFKRQEALVLERQGIEEINTPNYQLFNSTQGYSVYGGWGQGQGF
jgi:hypothetical protein